jgi:hypothetical protein
MWSFAQALVVSKMIEKPQWTEDRVALLKDQLAKGYSFGIIAQNLNCGFSRNACIGKAKRLGFKSQLPSPFKQTLRLERPKRPKQELAPKAYKAREKYVFVAAETFYLESAKGRALLVGEGFEGQQGRVSLDELQKHHCRFPIDQPEGPVRYCGNQVHENSKWCLAHKIRATVDRPQSRDLKLNATPGRDWR